MKKRFKKQKRKMLLSVICVLITAWIVVSFLFSFSVLKMELDSQINDEHYRNSEYFHMVNGGYVNNLFHSTERMRQNSLISTDFISGSIEDVYDRNFQAVVFEKDTAKLIFNTAESIDVIFYGLDMGRDLEVMGFVSYDKFRSSLTDEQYELIESYLRQAPDENGYRYCLIATEFYLDFETSEIVPSKIDIAYRNEFNRWHSTGSIAETLELNPQGCENMEHFKMDYDRVNYIPHEFALGEFSSGNILTDAEEPVVFKFAYEYFDTVNNPKVDRESLFTYVYHNVHQVYTTAEPVDEIITEETEAPEEFLFYVKYIKRLDLLEGSKNFLVFGLGGIFLFFAGIGVLLSVLLMRTVDNQLKEDQKRREVTNALAHDIKTPLFIIEGYAQSLKENINTDKHPHYVDRIIERTKEVNSLVHKMLDFSRLDSATYNPVITEMNLTELVRKISDDFDNPEDNKSIKLELKEDVSVDADISLMERAFTNLLENAVKYSEPQTVIAVELTDNKVCFSNVTKNMVQNDLKRLTEPYFRMDKNRNTKGNGLGLSVVKSVCEIHGFRLDIGLSDDIIKFTITF